MKHVLFRHFFSQLGYYRKLYKLSATIINWLRDELDELGEGDFMESPSTRGADVPLGDWG
jgi:hypothetical protein